jgi:hypothetical protein
MTSQKSAAHRPRKTPKAKRTKADHSVENELDTFDAEAQMLAKQQPENLEQALSDEDGAGETDAAERGDELPANGGEGSSTQRATGSGAKRSSSHPGKRASQPARKRSSHKR